MKRYICRVSPGKAIFESARALDGFGAGRLPWKYTTDTYLDQHVKFVVLESKGDVRHILSGRVEGWLRVSQTTLDSWAIQDTET
jgi:hypothetical protein